MEYIGNIIYDDKLMHADRKFIIFGVGIYGKKVLKYLTLNGLSKNIICFCDSSEKYNKCSINGIPVCQTRDVIKKFSDADYLVSGKYAKEMYLILRQAGIEKIHLLMF